MHPVPRYARAARAAYFDGERAAADYTAAGLTFVDAFAAPSMQSRAAASVGPDELVIMIRGTSNRSNALTDARIVPTSFRPARMDSTVEIHRGWVDEWRSLREWVVAVCTSFLPRIQRVTIGGHSLGGSTSSVGAADLAVPVPVVSYTYGSPRVGLAGFAAAYPKAVQATTRVVHALDIVPTVPSPIAYRHVCDPLHLADSGQVIDPCHGEFCEWLGWQRQLLADIDGEAEGDHHIDRYVAACDAFAARQPTGIAA